MKRFTPLKYVFMMILIFIIIPIIAIVIAVNLIDNSNISYAIIIFAVGVIVFLGPVSYTSNRENASVVINDTSIVNNIFDGTYNHGWVEDISKIKKIELVNNEVVQRYYKNCRTKRAILIDFGCGNIKYIAADSFTKVQIKKIISIIEYKRSFLNKYSKLP